MTGYIFLLGSSRKVFGWSYHSSANVISTPLVKDDHVFFWKSIRKFEALDAGTSQVNWPYQTSAGIFYSTTAMDGLVIFRYGHGNIYALNTENGDLEWKVTTGAAVLGSPIIEGDSVHIGGSDGKFRALSASIGEVNWEFEGLQRVVVSKPLLSEGFVIFGAWDKNLYALDQNTGLLKWAWNNGSPNRIYSTVMYIPVTDNGIVSIVAPDRYPTALDIHSGKELWRSNEATVRESFGIS
ncbi:outer membrane protein assembly factor BamB family protein [Algoriphagus yeomjeoni]|uniref:outer membrane protein assembly factor BamB family protein n=1 Tax=Algoriphagus yeomjeoni TaxID=291403 RepID=UPI000DB91EC1|nr:PQQ-binding-like beta-propeller repeat protein [Algoriphagus yeomjeoni]